MNSEQYRQMLVRDGERRFREWHQSFLAYQQHFQQAMAAKRSAVPRPTTQPAATPQRVINDSGASTAPPEHNEA